MKATTVLNAGVLMILSGCASGPPPVYVDLDSAAGTSRTAIVLGRSVSQGPELVVLRNAATDKQYVAIRSISFNREQQFAISVEPGTYAVQALGVHGTAIGAKEHAFTFSVGSGEAVYVGTFINEFHPPLPDEVRGRVAATREYGPMACKKLLCKSYHSENVGPPFRRVALIDESETQVETLREQIPSLRSVEIMRRLATQ